MEEIEDLYVVLITDNLMPKVYSYGSISEIKKDIENLILEHEHDEDEIYVCKGVNFKTYKDVKITVEIKE
jgi:hypothetical protein